MKKISIVVPCFNEEENVVPMADAIREEFKKNPILLAMYDRVKECKKNLSVIRDEITDNKAKKQNLNSNINQAKADVDELEKNLGIIESSI